MRGLRVETAGGTSSGRPLLVRLTLDEAGSSRLRAPSRAYLRLAWAGGAITREAVAVAGAAYLFAELTPAGHGPYVLEVEAEGLTAQVPVRETPPPPVFIPVMRPMQTSGLEVVVEGGALVPEVEGRVLVRALAAAGAEIALAGDEFVTIAPARAVPDPCGVVAFGVTVRGLSAHATASVLGAPERALALRLPVMPGGLSVRGTRGAIEVATAVGGLPVYVLAGDERGSTYWSAVRLDDADERTRTRIQLPDDAAWALVSASPSFETFTGLWLTPPLQAPCTQTHLGERFARSAASLPSPPAVALVHDGPAIAQRARDQRRARIRLVALLVASASVFVMVGAVLRAGLRADSEAPRDVSVPLRRRGAFVLAGAAAVLLGGLVLFATFLLRR